MTTRAAAPPPARARTTRRSAVEKRDRAAPPVVKRLRTPKSAAFPAGDMLIASPREVQALLMRVPEGRVVRFGTLRAQLATRFAADYTCPITTGIFLRIAADAAEEERLLGASALMPWWRVVRDDGALLTKLPGGAAAQARHLAREGHEITHVRGVPRKVADVESAAVVPRVRRAKVPTIGR